MHKALTAIAAIFFAVGAVVLGYGLYLTAGAGLSLPKDMPSVIKEYVKGDIPQQNQGEGQRMPSENLPIQQPQPQPRPVTAEHIPVKSGGYYWYNRLSSDEQLLYKKIEKAVPECQNYIDCSDLYITKAQLEKVIQFFDNDHPDYFWVSKSYQYRYDQANPDKILLVVLLFSDGTETDLPGTGLTLESEADRSVIYNQRTEFNKKVEEFLATVPANASDLEKEKAAHDFVVDRVTYDTAALESTEILRENSYNSYGALVEGLAVCEGYSELFQYLCNQLGLNCIVVSGISENQNHQWNILWINNTPVNVDPTWNDNQAMDDLGQRSYLYYNVSDRYLSRTHKLVSNLELSTQEYISMVPICSSSDYYYYNNRGIILGNELQIPDNTMEVIRGVLLRGEGYLLIFFPSGIEGNDLTSWVNSQVLKKGGEVDQEANMAVKNSGIDFKFGNEYYTFSDINMAAIKIKY